MQPSSTAATKPKNVESIFIAKGIAIAMVVWVHAFYVYPFHLWPGFMDQLSKVPMPMFFFMSGYLMSYQGGLEKALDVGYVLSKKAKRLVYPFITIAVASFFIKVLASRFALLEHPANTHAYLNLFIDPINSHMPLLWYIYVVTIIFLMFPFLLRALRRPQYVLLASLALFYLPWPQIFSLRLVFDHLPFFALGFMLGLKYDLDDLQCHKPRYFLPAAVILAGSLYMLIVSQAWLVAQVSYMLMGFSAIAVIQIMARTALAMDRYKLLRTFGYYSMGIYLLHTMCSSPVRIAYQQIFHLPSLGGIPIAEVTAGILGLAIPIFLEKYLLRRFSLSRRYILGIYS